MEVDDNTNFFTPDVDEVKKLHENQEMDLKDYEWPLLKKKLESGVWHCIAAKIQEQIVGYSFYSTKECSFAGSKKISFKLPQNTAYVFRSFVHPNCRNKGVGQKLILYRRLKLLNLENTSSTFAAINSTNSISLHNSLKFGSVIGAVLFVKIRSLNIVLISRGISKYGLEILK